MARSGKNTLTSLLVGRRTGQRRLDSAEMAHKTVVPCHPYAVRRTPKVNVPEKAPAQAFALAGSALWAARYKGVQLARCWVVDACSNHGLDGHLGAHLL